uniref:Uncharacterized protein n=1 Tax=Astyanax mexicanus TaxID=7994 RepID=A0A3B1IX12_ASTMX
MDFSDIMLLLVLCCLWITPSSFALEFKYHNSVQVGQYLTEVSRNYSDITYLHSIGQSVEALTAVCWSPKAL